MNMSVNEPFCPISATGIVLAALVEKNSHSSRDQKFGAGLFQKRDRLGLGHSGKVVFSKMMSEISGAEI